MITLRMILSSGIHRSFYSRLRYPITRHFLLLPRGQYIIDVIKSRFYLQQISKLLKGVQKILFISTKAEARKIIKVVAIKAQGYYVNYKWVSGLLTNFLTARLCVLKTQYLQSILLKPLCFSPKEVLSIQHKLMTLNSYFQGIKMMLNLPKAAVVVGNEINAILECAKLKIPLIIIGQTLLYKNSWFVLINRFSARALGLIFYELVE